MIFISRKQLWILDQNCSSFAIGKKCQFHVWQFFAYRLCFQALFFVVFVYRHKELDNRMSLRKNDKCPWSISTQILYSRFNIQNWFILKYVRKQNIFCSFDVSHIRWPGRNNVTLVLFSIIHNLCYLSKCHSDVVIFSIYSWASYLK